MQSKSYMEITELINQIFSAQGMNQVNASITFTVKFPEIAIFTVSNAMGKRIEPECVEPCDSDNTSQFKRTGKIQKHSKLSV